MKNKFRVNLEPMRGLGHDFKYKIKDNLVHFLVTIIVSGLIAFGAATTAQNQYQKAFGFLEVKEKTEKIQLEKKDHDLSTDIKVLDDALTTLFDATDEAADSAKEFLEDNAVTESFQKIEDEYNLVRTKLYNLGNKIVFWVSFILAFIVFYYIVGKITKLKKALKGDPVDPAVENNIKMLANTVNELSDELEQLRAQKPPPPPAK